MGCTKHLHCAVRWQELDANSSLDAVQFVLDSTTTTINEVHAARNHIVKMLQCSIRPALCLKAETPGNARYKGNVLGGTSDAYDEHCVQRGTGASWLHPSIHHSSSRIMLLCRLLHSVEMENTAVCSRAKFNPTLPLLCCVISTVLHGLHT